ncbi:glycosyltransferase family 39 protein [Algoriphagus halophytocola]|uniref:glycosyltransferase family 39 protein n=1 Tax=Algoriphagus halophytocola TaxID=2991499 RepID=UPI0022DE9286|nr:glycosyltransferase family 39 protein [Algoriphagus sp. TR-M9]WBL41681.1 glycosyltransferase family 39 protein [Algoriphagus sp. TR-M9]
MNQRNLLLCGFILLKLVLQYLLIDSGYDLHRDEYLHLDQAHHLAWGYISVPPVTSWFSYLIYLLGNTGFWVKFFPALFGALTILLVWKSIEKLGGNLYACSLAATALTFSALARLNLLFQPNSFDILAWTFIFYTLLRHIQTGKVSWLYWMGVGFGFGFLNKYTVLFLAFGVLLGLMLTPERKIFKNPHLYAGLGLGFLIALPNIIWQVVNDYPVIWHMKMLSKYQLVNVSRVDFLAEQVLFFLGSIFILIAAFLSFFSYSPFKKYRFLFFTLISTLVTFAIFRAKAYYAISLYPIFFAFGSIYLAHLLELGWKRYLKPFTYLTPIVFFLLILPLVFPIKPPKKLKEIYASNADLDLTRWEDGEVHDIPQDFADMLGWKELAEKVDLAYSKSPETDHTLIICDNYGQAGAINFYTKIKGLRAVTMNADYVNWISLDQPIKHVILVREASDQVSEREISLFEKSAHIGSISDSNAREFGTNIHLLVGAKSDINSILASEIEEKKAELKMVK